MSVNTERIRYSDVCRLVSGGRLFDAINYINKEIAQSQSALSLKNRINAIEDTYKYMLHYLKSGMSDNERSNIYNSLTKELLDITLCIDRLCLIDSDSRDYYATARMLRMHPVNLAELSPIIKNELNTSILNSDALRNLLNYIWTTHPLTAQDSKILYELIMSDEQNNDGYVGMLSCAALLLGCLEYYDSEKLCMLLRIYLHTSSDNIASRAITGAVLLMLMHPENIAIDQTANRYLQIIVDDPHSKSDLKAVVYNMLRALDTDRINKKMKEEVIPELMKLQPEIQKRFSQNIKDSDLIELEENPEWRSILEKTGLHDKLKELTEMQMNGGDVMMMAFSNLKNFPFFQYLFNWFTPFTISHPDVANLINESETQLNSIFESEGLICDSDKYSLALTMLSMPESHKNMMFHQLSEQVNQLNEDKKTSLKTSLEDYRSKKISVYMRDLYRFFKLYRKKNDFIDPFTNIDKLTEFIISGAVFDDETLRIFSEFYFSRGFYEQAILIYEMIIENGNADEAVYQKLGYSYQSIKKYSLALVAYQKAEILNPDSTWLIKKLASCHRALLNYSQAIDYYRRIMSMQPDNAKIAILLGHTLLENGNPEEALKEYYKAEYLAPDSEQWLRPIAWCEFLSGRFEKSLKYYNKVLAHSPTASDFMNCGHVYMAANNYPEAYLKYKESIKLFGDDITPFIKEFETDRNVLNKTGVPDLDINLMLDSLRYKDSLL